MTNQLVQRVETPTGHYYINPQTNQPIPGVTTILKALPKGALETWKIKQAVNLALKGEEAWKDKPPGLDLATYLVAAGDREANKAANIGTAAHEFAELHMLGQEPVMESYPKKVQKHIQCYLEFVRDLDPQPILVEKVLTHIDPKTGEPLYCGTMDLVARLTDGFVWLIDYKASSGQARPSHALQASAYRYATHWLDETTGELIPMPETHRAAVVLLNGGGTGKCYRAIELDAGPVTFSVFKSLLRVSRFEKIQDRVILGEL